MRKEYILILLFISLEKQKIVSKNERDKSDIRSMAKQEISHDLSP